MSDQIKDIISKLRNEHEAHWIHQSPIDIHELRILANYVEEKLNVAAPPSDAMESRDKSSG